MLRPPKSGNVAISGKMGHVHFRVVTPSDEMSRERSSMISRDKSKMSVKSGRSSALSRWARASGVDDDDRIDDNQLTLGSAEDGRVHIIWSIDASEVQKRFEEEYVPSFLEEGYGLKSPISTNGVEPYTPRSGDRDKVLDVGASPGAKSEDSGISSDGIILHQRSPRTPRDSDSDMSADIPCELPRNLSASALDLDTFVEDYANRAKPLIDDGQRIEYFSLSHKRWMPAIMQVEYSLSGNADAGKSIIYHADLGHGSKHLNVPLDCVRRLFSPGELVQVYSHRQGGEWLAAEIYGAQGLIPTNVGYTVRLTGSQQVLENIPSARLRHRFPPGMQVRVLRTCDRSWVKGVVADTAPDDGIGAKSIPVGVSDDTTRLPEHERESAGRLVEADEMLGTLRDKMRKKFRETKSSSALPKFLLRSASSNLRAAITSDRDLIPWVEVPVLCDGASTYEMLPSYRLRQCTALSEWEGGHVLV